MPDKNKTYSILNTACIFFLPLAYLFILGASATCMPTPACTTRAGWAVSVSTTPQDPTAAAVRDITTAGPGAWAPTCPYPKEQPIYVSITVMPGNNICCCRL